MRYAIVIEGGDGGYSAFAPDVLGCAAAADSVEEVTALLREALALHLSDLLATGQPIPPPSTRVATGDVEPAPLGASRQARPAPITQLNHPAGLAHLALA